MLNFLKREKYLYILLFSLLGVFFSNIGFFAYGNQLINSFEHHNFLRNTSYNYVYKTDKKMLSNSFIDFGSTQIFYLNESTTDRLNVKSVMFLDINYDEHSFITKNNLLEGEYTNLSSDEVLITQKAAQDSKLKLKDVIYSKSKVTLEIEAYRVKGIIRNVYWIGYT